MRLSEAIRLGAMLRPQGFGCSSGNKGSEHKCAIGAALLAIGDEQEINSLGYAVILWPFLGNKASNIPDGMRLSPIVSTNVDVIWSLNDNCHWTRERIADWVATIEPPDAPVAPACEVREEATNETRSSSEADCEVATTRLSEIMACD